MVLVLVQALLRRAALPQPQLGLLLMKEQPDETWKPVDNRADRRRKARKSKKKPQPPWTRGADEHRGYQQIYNINIIH